MQKGVTKFQILLASPSDIKKEIESARKAIEQFNNSIGKHNHISLQPSHWETDSYSEAGDSPQNLLNKQLLDESDAVIAIFWTRFGSPTEDYESGTKEEIEKMLEREKQVFLYFCEKEVKMENVNSEQYQKLKKFKKEYQEKGIYKTYESLDEFEKVLTNDLNKYFLNEVIDKNNQETKKANQSNLSIYSFYEEKLHDSLEFIKFDFLNSDFMNFKLDDICKQIKEVKRIDLKESKTKESFNKKNLGNKKMKDLTSFEKSLAFTEMKKEPISSEDKKLIKRIARKEDINLGEDWFSLGNLKVGKSTLKMGVLGNNNQTNLFGSDTEKKKFNKIESIIREAKFYFQYKRFFEAFENLRALELVLENDGSKFDEDITIKLFIPKGEVLFPKDFKEPEERIIDDINDNLLRKILVPRRTHNVNSYPDDYNFIPSANKLSEIDPFSSKTYEEKVEDFSNKISSFFIYDYFHEDEVDILRFNQSYLKHNERNFFPTTLFFRNNVDSIKYEIKSKHYPKKIEGILN